MLHALRMVALAVHFVLACVLGLAVVLVRPFNPDNTRLCARLFSWPALRILGLRWRLEGGGLEPVMQGRPCVIVANHQSNFDLFVLGCAVPRRTVTLGKKSLKWIPLFGQLYWLAGNVLIDRDNARRAKRAMMTTTETLQHRDTSIWVFPEGTRNLGRGLLPFKKGAFQMAVNAGVPIVPLCCSTYKRHMRLNRWRSGTVAVRVLPPIETEGLAVTDVPRVMAQCRAAMEAAVTELDREAEAFSR